MRPGTAGIMLLRSAFLLAVPSALAATTTSSSSSATSTSSAAAATHTISVGRTGFSFEPNSTTANTGDTIKFVFYPSNHSVVQAAFGSACIPYSYVGGNPDGFWSGFELVDVSSEDLPSYEVIVNDTTPIFYYCSAPGACNEDGMVGVINPAGNETFSAQLADAKTYDFSLSPGEPYPSEETDPTSSASPTSTSTSSASSSATTAVESKGKSSGLSTGAIVGIAIGGAAVLVLAAALLYMCGRQKTITEILSHRNDNTRAMSEGHRSYISGPLSPTLESNYSGANNRGSGLTGFGRGGYDFENESYRSRSPPVDENLLHNNLYATPHEMGGGGYNGQRPAVPDGSPYWTQKSEFDSHPKPSINVAPAELPATMPATKDQRSPPGYEH